MDAAAELLLPLLLHLVLPAGEDLAASATTQHSLVGVPVTAAGLVPLLRPGATPLAARPLAQKLPDRLIAVRLGPREELAVADAVFRADVQLQC